MRERAKTRQRFGDRSLLMPRESWRFGNERGYRIYTEEGAALRRKQPWRHNMRGIHVVVDQLADGLRLRASTVIDLHTRSYLEVDIGQCLGRQIGAATIERLRFERGTPQRTPATTAWGLSGAVNQVFTKVALTPQANSVR